MTDQPETPVPRLRGRPPGPADDRPAHQHIGSEFFGRPPRYSQEEIRSAMRLLADTVNLQEARQEYRIPASAIHRWERQGRLSPVFLPVGLIEGNGGPKRPRYRRAEVLEIQQEDNDRMMNPEKSKYFSAEWMTRKDAEMGSHPSVTPSHLPMGHSLLGKLITAGLIRQEWDRWGGQHLFAADVVRESNPATKSWLTREEVALYLNISTNWVSQLAAKGDLARIVGIPGHPLYYRSSVEELAGGAGV